MLGKRKEPEVYLGRNNKLIENFMDFYENSSTFRKIAIGAIVLSFIPLSFIRQKISYNSHLKIKQAEINQLETIVNMYQTENFILTSAVNRYMAEATSFRAKNFEISLNTFLKHLKNYSTKSSNARDFYAYLNGRKNQIMAADNTPTFLMGEILKEYNYNPIFQSNMNYLGNKLDPGFLSDYFPLPIKPSENQEKTPVK